MTLDKIMEKCSWSFAYSDKSAQNWGSKLLRYWKYSRPECLKTSGFPELLKHSEVEGMVLKLCKELDVEIDSSILRIVTCCQVMAQKEPLLSFPKKKDACRIQKVKENLKGMDFLSIGSRSPDYKNDNLCKYYKMLWRKFKKTLCK